MANVTGVKRYTIPSGPSGTSYAQGTVVGVDGNIAQVRLDLGKVVEARIDWTRGKSFAPAAGERWILDTYYGTSWYFAVYLGITDGRTYTWTSAAFNSGWVNYSTPGSWTPGSGLYRPVQYRLTIDGRVTLQGAAAGPAVSALDTAGPISADIFQLPVWARPDAEGQLLFGTASGQIKVFPDGWVRAVTGTAAKTLLDGVSFLVS